MNTIIFITGISYKLNQMINNKPIMKIKLSKIRLIYYFSILRF